jgi:hypothetical protein
MRDTDWTPSIVPGDDDRDTCLVVNDFGRRGRAWCGTDVEATDLETVIQDLLDGQFSEPVRVVSSAFRLQRNSSIYARNRHVLWSETR